MLCATLFLKHFVFLKLSLLRAFLRIQKIFPTIFSSVYNMSFSMVLNNDIIDIEKPDEICLPNCVGN